RSKGDGHELRLRCPGAPLAHVDRRGVTVERGQDRQTVGHRHGGADPHSMIGHGGEGVLGPQSGSAHVDRQPTGTAPYRLGPAPEHTMKRPARDAGRATAAIGAEAQTTLALENMPMSDVIQALATGRVTATALTKGYLARIEACDRDGPKLNSVRELNADALTIAGKLNDAKPSVEQPLAGV